MVIGCCISLSTCGEFVNMNIIKEYTYDMIMININALQFGKLMVV